MDSISINKEALLSRSKVVGGSNDSRKGAYEKISPPLMASKPARPADKVDIALLDVADQNNTSHQYGQMGRQAMITDKREVDNWLARQIDSDNDSIIQNDEFAIAKKEHTDLPLARLLGEKPGVLNEFEKTELGQKIDVSDDGNISRKELISFIEANPGDAKEIAKNAVLENRPSVDNWLARKIDVNGNGKMERDEFMAAQEKHPHISLARALGEKPEVIEKLQKTGLGKLIDTSKDGSISRKELYEFKTGNPKITLKDAILDATDTI